MVYQIITVIMLIKILEKVSKLVELSLFYKADKYNVGAAWINRCTLLKLFCLLQSFQHPYKFKAKIQWSYTVSSKQSTTTAESACVLTDNNAINWVKIHQFCRVGIWDIRLL